MICVGNKEGFLSSQISKELTQQLNSFNKNNKIIIKATNSISKYHKTHVEQPIKMVLKKLNATQQQHRQVSKKNDISFDFVLKTILFRQDGEKLSLVLDKNENMLLSFLQEDESSKSQHIGQAQSQYYINLVILSLKIHTMLVGYGCSRQHKVLAQKEKLQLLKYSINYTINKFCRFLQTNVYQKSLIMKQSDIQTAIMASASKYFNILKDIHFQSKQALKNVQKKQHFDQDQYSQTIVSFMSFLIYMQSKVLITYNKDGQSQDKTKANQTLKTQHNQVNVTLKQRQLKEQRNKLKKSKSQKNFQSNENLSKTPPAIFKNQVRNFRDRKNTVPVKTGFFSDITNLVKGKLTQDQSTKINNFSQKIINQGQSSILQFYINSLLKDYLEEQNTHLQEGQTRIYKITKNIIKLYTGNNQFQKHLLSKENKAYNQKIDKILQSFIFKEDESKVQKTIQRYLALLTNIKYILDTQKIYLLQQKSPRFTYLINFLIASYQKVILNSRILGLSQQSSACQDIGKRTSNSQLKSLKDIYQVGIHQMNYEVTIVLSKIVPKAKFNKLNLSELNILLSIHHQIFMNQLNFCQFQLPNTKQFLVSLQSLKHSLFRQIQNIYRLLEKLRKESLDLNKTFQNNKLLQDFQQLVSSFENILLDSLKEISQEFRDNYLLFIVVFPDQWIKNCTTYSKISENCFDYIGQLIVLIIKQKFSCNEKGQRDKNGLLMTLRLIQLEEKFIQTFISCSMDPIKDIKEYDSISIECIEIFQKIAHNQAQHFSEMLRQFCIPKSGGVLDYLNLKSLGIVERILDNQLITLKQFDSYKKKDSQYDEENANEKSVQYSHIFQTKMMSSILHKMFKIVQKVNFMIGKEPASMASPNAQVKLNLRSNIVAKMGLLNNFSQNLKHQNKHCISSTTSNTLDLLIEIILQNCSGLKQKISEQQYTFIGQEIMVLEILLDNFKQINNFNTLANSKGSSNKAQYKIICSKIQKLLVVIEVLLQLQHCKLADQIGKKSYYFNQIISKTKVLTAEIFQFLLYLRVNDLCKKQSLERFIKNIITMIEPNINFLDKIKTILENITLRKETQDKPDTNFQYVVSCFGQIIKNYQLLQSSSSIQKDYKVEIHFMHIMGIFENHSAITHVATSALLQIQSIKKKTFSLFSKQKVVDIQNWNCMLEAQLIRSQSIPSLLKQSLVLNSLKQALRNFQVSIEFLRRTEKVNILQSILSKLTKSSIIQECLNFMKNYNQFTHKEKYTQLTTSNRQQQNNSFSKFQKDVFDVISQLLGQIQCQFINHFDKSNVERVPSNLMSLPDTPCFKMESNKILINSFKEKIFEVQEDQLSKVYLQLQLTRLQRNKQQQDDKIQNTRKQIVSELQIDTQPNEKAQKEKISQKQKNKHPNQQLVESSTSLEDLHKGQTGQKNWIVKSQNLAQNLDYFQMFYQKILIYLSKSLSQNNSEVKDSVTCSLKEHLIEPTLIQMQKCLKIAFTILINKGLFRQIRWMRCYLSVLKQFMEIQNCLIQTDIQSFEKYERIFSFYIQLQCSTLASNSRQIFFHIMFNLVNISCILLNFLLKNGNGESFENYFNQKKMFSILKFIRNVGILICRNSIHFKQLLVKEKRTSLTHFFQIWDKVIKLLISQNPNIIYTIAQQYSIDDLLILPESPQLVQLIQISKRVTKNYKGSSEFQTCTQQQKDLKNILLLSENRLYSVKPSQLVLRKQYNKALLLFQVQAGNKSLLQEIQYSQEIRWQYFQFIFCHVLNQIAETMSTQRQHVQQFPSQILKKLISASFNQVKTIQKQKGLMSIVLKTTQTLAKFLQSQSSQFLTDINNLQSNSNEKVTLIELLDFIISCILNQAEIYVRRCFETDHQAENDNADVSQKSIGLDHIEIVSQVFVNFQKILNSIKILQKQATSKRLFYLSYSLISEVCIDYISVQKIRKIAQRILKFNHKVFIETTILKGKQSQIQNSENDEDKNEPDDGSLRLSQGKDLDQKKEGYNSEKKGISPASFQLMTLGQCKSSSTV